MKKKNFILLPLMAAILLASCQRENFGGSAKSSKINLLVNDNPLSKSPAGEELLFSVPFEDDNGKSYVVRAYLSDFNSIPGTKGEAVTTDNIGTLLGGFKTSVFKDGSPYVDFEGQSMADVTVKYDNTDTSNPFWKLLGAEKDAYYWPKDNSGINFCSYAPATLEYGTMTTPVWNASTGTATFTYTMPEPMTERDGGGYYNDAYNQPDILFASDAGQTRESHKEGGHSYARINFQHALLALRFTRGATLNDCTIKDVVLKNFYSTGKATFDSNSTPMFTWTDTATPKTYRETFNYDISEVPRATGDKDSGGSLDISDEGYSTFMLIPQVLPANATICIYVENRVHPIEFCIGSPDTGNAANDALLKDWSKYAGKVLTLRVESDNMDSVQLSLEDRSWSLKKSNVYLKNVGTHGVYLRVALVANIIDNNDAITEPVDIGDITDITNTDFTLSADWSTYWSYNSADGFYYYTYVLPAGKYTYCDIFESYEVHDSHVIDEELTVKFDVVAQAIDAQDATGSFSADVLSSTGWPASMITNPTTAMGVATK